MGNPMMELIDLSDKEPRYDIEIRQASDRREPYASLSLVTVSGKDLCN
jgi:hypothetical protein